MYMSIKLMLAVRNLWARYKKNIMYNIIRKTYEGLWPGNL